MFQLLQGFIIILQKCYRFTFSFRRNHGKLSNMALKCRKIKYSTYLILVLSAIFFFMSAACANNMFDQAAAGPSIVINEVVTSNGHSYENDLYGSPDWIELKNVSSRSVSLLGYRITDNIQKAEKAYVLPDIRLEPGEFLLLLASKEQETDTLSYENGPVFTGFSLKLSGEHIALEDSNLQLVHDVSVPALLRDVSYARTSEGSFGFCAAPTPGAENTSEIYSSLTDIPAEALDERVPAATDPFKGIVINEISARNNTTVICSGCDECDWIELHNITSETISLEGFSLTDDPDDYDKPNLSGTIPANGYLLVLCCTSGCSDADGHFCLRMGLSRYGDHLYLFDTNGLLSAETDLPETPKKDVSYALDEEGNYHFTIVPTPGDANVIEEYVDIPKPTEEPEPIFTGLSGSVIISEVLPSNEYSLTDRDGDRNDWVELFNTTSSDISLNGWYLSDSNNFRKWAFPPDVVIPGDGYLLVFLSGKESNESELHAGFSAGEGESITLFNSNDYTYDQLKIETSKSNISVGRDAESNIIFYSEPTPLGPNGHARKEAESIGFFPYESVFISEVCAIHNRGSDEDDWIELYNGGSEPCDISECFLSDDYDKPEKFRFSNTVIAPGEYITVSVSRYRDSFSVSPTGETIYLIDKDRKTILDSFDTGVQRLGMSSGRIENDPSIRRVFFTSPTKGAANHSPYELGYTSAPTFSETNLYHESSFELKLSCLQKGAEIYYTTNGSDPSVKSNRYTGPIKISKNTPVRAVAICSGLMDSEIITYTYLFEKPHTVPVVCISMDPDDLKTVSRVSEHSKIKERKCYVNYYEADGGIGVSFPSDIKAKGRGTLGYAQKSFTLGLRAAYGYRTVKYPFFPNYEFTEFGALALRNAGQDHAQARMRDSFVSRACVGLNVDVSNSRNVVVYLNGSYNGLYDLDEELNSKYLETHYGVDPDTVNTIMRNGSTAMKGEKSTWKSLFAQAKDANLSTESKYREFLQYVDEDYFIDYVICRTFMLETDTFNQKYWRTTDYKIKWRPILYDLDFCFMSGVNRDIMHLYFNKGGTPSANGSLTYFYITVALKTNPTFCQKFVERYVEVVYTQFTAERLLKLFDDVVAEIEPEMQRHISKWKTPSTMSKWQKEVQTLRKKVAERPNVVLEQVRKEFKLSKEEMNALIAKYDHH